MSTAIAIAERTHAVLSPSSAHRWLNCTPSAKLERQFPESQSSYADEGKLAHAVAELKMRKYFIEPIGVRAFNNRLKKLAADPLYQEEMVKHADAYLEYAQGIVHEFTSKPYVAVEKTVDFTDYVPEGFGTADLIIISGDTLYVNDYKYGKGVPVSAVFNPQMRLYALGAYAAYSILYPIQHVRIAIIQPRLNSVSEEEITIEELLAWGESVKPIALKAYKGEGEYVSGDHCRFCRAKALCRVRADFHTGLEEEFKMMKPPLISNEEIGQILLKTRNLVNWVKDLEEFALNECLQGNEIPGWKAVEGRSTRQFTNQDEAFKVLTGAGYKEAILYKREPLTLAAIEKLISKSRFDELLTGYVNKPPGKPALVQVSDKREAITRISAEQAFGDNSTTTNENQITNENGGNENGQSTTN